MKPENQSTATYRINRTPELEFFKRQHYVFNIYVEDRNPVTVDIWKSILKKILPRNCKYSIHSSEGKIEALKQCRNEDECLRERRLYIIDADMDILTGDQQPKYQHLYQLPVYCMENYLLEEQNIVKLCKILHTKESVFDDDEGVKQHFNFSEWKGHNERLLEKLFICYATVQLAGKNRFNTKRNVQNDVNKFCQPEPNNDLLCPEKIDSLVEKMYNDLYKRNHNESKIDILKKQITNNAKRSNFMKYVCGKTHLLILIYNRLINKYKMMDIEHVKKILGINISPEFDPKLKKKILELIEKYEIPH